MTRIADLHIHSKYSRATSSEGDAPHLDLWARRKGIHLVGTGDFTHPQWRAELKEMLEPEGNGLYRLKPEYALPCAVPGAEAPRFIVTGEISTIYKRDGKTRKVHHVILLPGLEEAEELSHRLEAIGNLHSDGRPILGLDSRDLLETVLESCPEAVYIPAHIWTPHFSLFGAFSGFDTIEECFGDLTPCVHALETGLSSDPPMNRRLSALDNYLLVSNSDAHSPAKLGREANLLSCGLTYSALKKALDTGEGFQGTIEFFPEEGKYHLDGHRACQCRLTPEETRQAGGRCPVCGKKITIGVLNRVEALADREQPGPLTRPFESLIPLPELIGETLGVSAESKKAQALYFELLNRLGPEFFILRECPLEMAEAAGGPLLSAALRRLRAGQVIRQSGYDGEYGVIRVFQPGEKEALLGQTSLLSPLSVQSPQKTAAKIKEKTVEKQEAPSPAPAPAFSPNPAQAAAISAEEDTVIVIAGPGAGKTGTLIQRIAWLIEAQGVSPREITAVTFTRQAAGEMRERLEKKLGKRVGGGVTVGTFHNVCLSLLPPMPLAERRAALDAAADILRERQEKMPPAEALRLISQAKNGLSPLGLPPGLLAQYQERLRQAGVRDLDDLLAEALEAPIAGKNQFHYLLVDEFQDLSPIQRALALHWSQGNKLFVIGDPDQSIYGFRGADAGCFDALQAARPGARVIRLTQNYRSSPEILACALAAIAKNPGPERRLLPACPPAGPVRWVSAKTSEGQYSYITKEIARLAGGVDMLNAAAGEKALYAFSEMAVLCRTRSQLALMEKCLTREGVPSVISLRGEELEAPVNQALMGFFTALLESANLAALDAALRGLWNCPAGLAQRAEAAWPLLFEQGEEAFREALAPFDGLSPLILAVERFMPLVRKEKPRKLLEGLMQEAGVRPSRDTEKLLNTAVFFDAMPAFLEAARTGEEGDIQRLSGGKPSGAVRLMTLHASKGLEFPVVFIGGLEEGRFPLEREGEATDIEEERRLFFVGITRARSQLILVSGGKPSPFLKEIGAWVQKEESEEKGFKAQAKQLSFF